MAREPDVRAAHDADCPPDFSAELEAWLGSDGPKTLGALNDVFGEKSFAVLIMHLMFLPALPLPTGGLVSPFEVIAIVVAAQMVLGRTSIWLPARWQRRELGELTTGKAVPFMIRRIRFFERFSRPRGAHLLERRTTLRILGLLFIALALAAMFAPPFSGLDTLPAFGAVVVALGIVLGDMVVVGVGAAIGCGGVALMLALGAAALRLLREMF